MAKRMGSGETARAREMRAVLGQWERSGLSQVEFARRRGVSLSGLRWWRYEFRRREREGRRKPRGGSKRRATPFIEIRRPAGLAAADGNRASFTVRLRGGIAVEVPMEFAASSLERLLTVLEGQRC